MKGKKGMWPLGLMLGAMIVLAIFAGPTVIDVIKGMFKGDSDGQPKLAAVDIEKDDGTIDTVVKPRRRDRQERNHYV